MDTEWKKVTLITKKNISTDTVSLIFTGKKLPIHTPGQFYLLRLSEKDKDIKREYSIANKPNTKSRIEFGIQKIQNGYVSNALHELKIGGTVEIKGPMGIYFNWDEKHDGTVLFIVGGAGIVPIMSMLRTLPSNRLVLLASFKSLDYFSYYEELIKLSKSESVDLTFIPILTREFSKEWKGRNKRIDKKLLQEIIKEEVHAKIYICGRSEFVESMNQMLRDLQVPQENIQRERFG